VYHGLKPGPKAPALLDPIDLSEAPPRGYRRLLWFADRYLVVPSGKGALEPFRFAKYQKDIFRGLLPQRGKRPTQGLVSFPRGNAKSTTAAVLAAYFLFADDRQSTNVLCVAKDLRQAGIVWNKVRRMIELNPELLARTKIHADRLMVPGSNSQCIPMPSDEDALQGWEGVFLLDELHVVTEAVWNACCSADGKVPDSLVFAFSTPAIREDSVMWQLCKGAREEPSRDFFFTEFSSDPSHPIDCRHCEDIANPAIRAGFLERASFAKVRKNLRESEYRRLRLGQWLTKVEDSFVSGDDLDAITTAETIPDGARVTVGLDGSATGDATVLTLATVDEIPLLDVARAWSPADELDEGYRVPVLEVEDTIRALCRRYDVAEIVADPWLFGRSLELLAAEGFPVVHFPQTRTRMGPATTGLYEAIRNRLVAITTNPMLRRHLLNARVHETAQGPVLRKDAAKSLHKIDAAVSGLMAYTRAAHLAKQPARRRRVVRTRR